MSEECIIKEKEEGYSIGFLPIKITIHKFVTWNSAKPQTVNFNGNLISVCGVNGAGKSLLIDAITYALYGKTTRSGNKIKELLDRGGFISFTFEKSGSLWEVTRGKSNSESMYVKVFQNGDEEVGKITDLNTRILNIMGMNYSTFLSTTLIPQIGESFTNITPRSRFDILSNIFKLDILEESLKYIKEDEKKTKEEYQLKQKEIEVISEYIINSDDLKKQITTINSNIHEKNQSIVGLNKEISQKEKVLLTLEKEKENYIKINSELESNKKYLSDYENKKNNLKKPSLNKDASKESEKIDQYESNIEKYNKVNEKSKEYEQKISSLKRERENVISNTKETLDKYKGLVSGSKEELKDVAFKALDSYKNEEITEKEQIIKKIIPYGFVDFLETTRSEGILKKKQYDKKISSLESKYNEFKEKYNKYISMDIKHYKSLLSNARTSKILVETYNNDIKNYVSLLSDYESNISKYREIIIKNESDLEVSKDSFKKYKETSDERVNLINEKDKIQSEIQNMQYQIKTLHEKINQNEENIKKKERCESELNNLNNEMGKYITLKSIFADFQAYALNYYLDLLSVEASKLVLNMTSHRKGVDGKGNPRQYSNISFTSKKNGIELLIDGRSSNMFSGGENAIIGIAIRIAISILLSQMIDMNSYSKTLIIDEGQIGAMDNDMTKMMMNMINETQNHFDKIVMITHKDNVLDNFDTFIEISPTGGSHVL